MMTEGQIHLVRESFERAARLSSTLAALFYTRLFYLDPSLVSLFTASMKEQGEKLMDMLALIARNLDAPDTLAPALRALGERHRRHGVRAEHYGTARDALLWSLRVTLNDNFTEECEAAWVAAFAQVRRLMTGQQATMGAPAPGAIGERWHEDLPL